MAEGAFALLISIMRRIKPLCRRLEEDGWVWPTEEWLGNDLAGKVVGLVGKVVVSGQHFPECVMALE